MWLFFIDDFLCVVQKKHDRDTLLVRSRNEGDIHRVFGRGVKVTRTPERDYLFRATIAREVVAEVVKRSIIDIDYGNFKNSIPKDRITYHDACSDVWTTMYHYQNDQAYPAKARRGRLQQHFTGLNSWWPDDRDAEIERYSADKMGVPDFVSPSERQLIEDDAEEETKPIKVIRKLAKKAQPKK